MTDVQVNNRGTIPLLLYVVPLCCAFSGFYYVRSVLITMETCQDVLFPIFSMKLEFYIVPQKSEFFLLVVDYFMLVLITNLGSDKSKKCSDDE